MNRFLPGNRITLLRSGGEYFPSLVQAIDGAEREVWLETYIYADDDVGAIVTAALVRAAQRGIVVRVLVDGWGARHYLTASIERVLKAGGVRLLKYRPEVAPWQFRKNRMRRLHRKLCHVDGRIAFVGGINIIDDVNTPGQKPPRVDFALRIEGPLLVSIVRTMERVWAINELVQFQESEVPLFPVLRRAQRMGAQTANSSFATTCATAVTSSTRTSPPSARRSARSLSPARISFPASASGARSLPRRSAASRSRCSCRDASSISCSTTPRARCTGSFCRRASRSRSTTGRSCTRRWR